LKLLLREERGDGRIAAERRFDAIAFGYDTASPAAEVRAGTAVDLAYRLEINEYNGAERVQLNCQHLGVR
jgi:hypothetical protein